MKNKLPLTWGLGEGRLVPIREARRGLACGCTCLACGAALQAKRGRSKTHHFAHYRATECAGAVETALHRWAKDTLAQARRVWTPPVIAYREDRPLQDGRWLSFSGSATEVQRGALRADVLLRNGGDELSVECKVRHPVNEATIRQYVRLGLAALEIDLWAIFNELAALGKADDLEMLHQRLLGDHRHRRWLFHPLKHRYEYGRRRRATRRPVHCRSWRGYQQYLVYDCPLSEKRIAEGFRRGRTYAHLWQQCAGCPHNLEIEFEQEWVGFREVPTWPRAVWCGCKE